MESFYIPILTAAPTVVLGAYTVTPDAVTIPIVPTIPYMAYAGRNDARVSQAGLEAVYLPDPAASISQVGLEVVYDQQVDIRVSQAGLEVAYDQVVPVHVSQVGLEVIYIPASSRKVFAEIIDS